MFIFKKPEKPQKEEPKFNQDLLILVVYQELTTDIKGDPN